MTQTNITTDQLALLSLKSQIISDPFRFLDKSWSPVRSVCQWIGVTCGSRRQRVKSLNLSNMALTGKIPREFGNLSFLVSLDLRSNNFHGHLPQEMAHLHRLKFLDLSFNNFIGEVPSWFGFLHQLQLLNFGNNSFIGSILLHFLICPHLILQVCSCCINYFTTVISYNSLQGNIPEEIGNLYNLNRLSIQYNQLTGSIPFTIFNISRIEIVSFTGNSLSGYLPNGLCNGLPILKGLYLSRNKLHGHISTSLSDCSQLQELFLSENDFIGEIPKEISNLIELEVLNIEINRFSVPLPMEIFNISGLRIIGISFNNLSGILPPNMGSILPNIESIYLINLTNLVGTIPHSLSNCSKLKIVELSHNKLTGLIPNSLGDLTHLQYLNLGDNNLTSDSSLSFLTSLTNCRNLKLLSLSYNILNGMLPAAMGNLSTSLRKFYFKNCTIKG
ncbi:hypothetical protein T459_34243 [Capsicum annuum]|uniref:Leucine-rich repeat-containing N-terminal plant-type domain-containing protein n=2 Tax=Capsicum annuum TaxID=4072 RepID=A0A2G2XWU4_CAPAN|nr:hypothetical protein T459_34243 [Capsicum annuum]